MSRVCCNLYFVEEEVSGFVDKDVSGGFGC